MQIQECLKYLKERKNLSLWFSGFFAAIALRGLIVALFDLEIVIPKIEYVIGRIEGLAWFIIAGAISAALCYYSYKQTKKIKPKA